MNDVIMAFGENAVPIAICCGVLIAAVLCALIVHDTWARREQLVRMREEDERHRQRSRYLREINKLSKSDLEKLKERQNQEIADLTNDIKRSWHIQ